MKRGPKFKYLVQRAQIRLYAKQGLSDRDISYLLGIPRSTVQRYRKDS
jgi:hypothetical protein